jgi:uncharacterized protein
VAQLNKQIHEVIVTTLSKTGQAHSAPMGITEVGNHFLIQPFKPSATYENLKHHRQCAINYTDDVRVFAGSLTNRRDWPTLPCEKITGQYLEQALAHSELEIIDFVDGDPRSSFTGNIVKDVIHAPFRGFNRAQSAVIEAAVLTSRLHMLSAEKVQQEIRYLAIAIEKTAGERELEAWGWLMTKIKDAGIELEHE